MNVVRQGYLLLQIRYYRLKKASSFSRVLQKKSLQIATTEDLNHFTVGLTFDHVVSGARVCEQACELDTVGTVVT